MARISRDIVSRSHLGFGIFVLDAFIILYYWMIMDSFTQYISDKVVMAYYLINVLIPLYLTRESTTNPKRNRFVSLMFGLMKDRKTYHADM